MSESMQRLEAVAGALRRRGYEAHAAATAGEARRLALSLVPEGASVACGGSVTVRELGLEKALRAQGHEVLWHWEVPPLERPALLHRAMGCPVYLCSANALTEDGMIVEIDGNGNRVSAMCYGPGLVLLLIGRNKLVSGGLQAAIRRVKQVACPLNARRQGLSTPCASGKCDEARCEGSMCSVIAAFERAPKAARSVAVLIDEDLGY